VTDDIDPLNNGSHAMWTDPNLHDRRIHIGCIELDMFSEVLHSHQRTGKGHIQAVGISRAFKKVDQEV
jgi:hypothetical protein